MSIVQIKKCDICGDEERSTDKPKYWANYHSDRVAIDFRFVPSVQQDLSKDHLCYCCARELHSIIADAIEYIKITQAKT